ncbi:MAG: TonB-dependent receptor [Prevotellaceae bacterium]|nr:TonB-dependent receptor [Prevotellaceae bacterium]
MELFNKYGGIPSKQRVRRISRAVKTLCVFALTSALAFVPSELYSQSKKFTFDEKNVSLESVISSIETQSGFSFFYTDEIDLSRKVSIKVKDVELSVLLDAVFKGSETTYKIRDKQIIIQTSSKNGRSQPAKSAAFKVTGTVSDYSGNPLPFVSVMVSGSSVGTSTDENGEFAVTVPSDTSVLQFSFVGYKPLNVKVGNRRIIAIVMEEVISELGEAVVVAFGRQKRESVVAAVTTIKPSELKVPSSNLTTALAGRMSGIISYQRSGEPGRDNADFFIRGVTTFGNGKKNPLILIDGVELSTDDLAKLNTDDIASFSVMKDANATALYGARGANGVILVTTKEGEEGQVKLSVRFENSFSAPVRKLELADPITYMLLGNEAVRTRDPLGIIPYSNEKIANTGKGNPYVYPVTDWNKLLFKDFTSNQRLNINVSGGGKAARYYIAASLNQDNGLLNVDKRNNFNSNIDLKQYLLRSNININMTKSTEMIVRLHGTFDNYTGPLEGGRDLYYSVMRTNPVLFPAYFPPDERNKFVKHILFGNADGGWINPYAEMVKGYKNYSKTLVLAQLEIKQDLNFITKGLSVRALFNTTRYSYFDVKRQYSPFYYKVGSYDKYTDTYRLTALNDETKGARESLETSEGGKDVYSTMYYEAAVQYGRTFAERHTVSGLFVITGRDELKANTGNLQLSLPYRNIGLAGRLTYGYKDRYFVEGNFGYNGSERFARNERFGFFPSIGAGYIISNEGFWEPLKKIVSKVKFKATYGLVGNDAIGAEEDRFFFLSQVNLSDSGRGMSFGTNFQYSRNGVSISRYADPEITWEKAYKQNYGIEIGLFDKIEIMADYFRETRKGILQKRETVPVTMGLQSWPHSNIGESFGSGFDASIDYQQAFASGLWVSARGSFTYAKSRYVIYEEPAYLDSPQRSRIGQNVRQEYGLIAERLFVDEADVRNSPVQQYGEYAAGDIKYKDINGDDMIDHRDQVPIGYPNFPEIMYGFGFSVGYKGFDFSAFFQGSARSSFWIDSNIVSPFLDTDGGSRSQNALLQVIADSHWSEDNRDPHAFWPRLTDHQLDNNTQRNTWFMRDGAFMRLKTAEIGYTLPKDLTKRVRMSAVRIYVSGNNLLTFSKFKLWDPEMAGDGLGYPVQRVFNLGINVNF